MLPDDGIVVDEVTQLGYVIWYGYPVHQPRRLVSSGFSGTLGYGFPTALGVKVANPDRPVVSVTGDGGFLFGGSDLSTAMQFGINLVTVVVNNASYGNVKRDQERLYEGRHSGAVRTIPISRPMPARSACRRGGSRRRRLPRRTGRPWPPSRRRWWRSSRTSTRTIRPTSSIHRGCPDGQLPTVERQRRSFVPDEAWLAKLPKEPILEPDLPIVDPHHHLWDRRRPALPARRTAGRHRQRATTSSPRSSSSAAPSTAPTDRTSCSRSARPSSSTASRR